MKARTAAGVNCAPGVLLTSFISFSLFGARLFDPVAGEAVFWGQSLRRAIVPLRKHALLPVIQTSGSLDGSVSFVRAVGDPGGVAHAG